MASIKQIGEHLTRHAPQLAHEIVNDIAGKFKVEVPENEIQYAKVIYTDFLGFLGELIACNEERVPQGLLQWSKENGEREASNKGKISGIITRYPDTRIAFTEHISKIALDYGLLPEDIITIVKRLNYFLDLSINETVFAFERHTDRIIKLAHDEVNELSAPVVPIQDGIAILPLIGSFDYDRAALILEKVVPKITRLKVNCLILDFSGILTIDAAIAKHIFDIHNVLRLIGVNTIATGIRPDLAQMVVSGGINLNSIKSFATVRQAIDSMKE